MSIVAIDFGLKRIGVAGCDDLRISSHPVKLVMNKPDKSHIKEIVEIIKERNAELVLVGMPFKDDGRLKIQDDIENFYHDLQRNTTTKIEYWNENFSSKEADNILIKKMNMSRKKRKNYQDLLSACLILDSYLRSL
ncbi:MAG: Holliday junction resolvase RuvX [Spirochaetales bacterium]|jgi:putative Holliday junction resolvase|nr:Holliday junction resolvase RuvX [Spirochaetales bacterium]|tara:strand:- start:124 stop:531 length:408 start_codon:yes stop_codon:yes gene_type:complete